ncbi:MAG: CDP-glycerol glycerophosphotransferase family protein [Lachnospira sp.]
MIQIDALIEKNKEKILQENLKNDWDKLIRVSNDTSIILYGAGNSYEQVCYIYSCLANKKIKLKCALDNDASKVGLILKNIDDFAEIDNDAIQPGAEIITYDKKTPIIICSMVHFNDIALELTQLGFYNVFSLAVMEFLRRQHADYVDIEKERIEYLINKSMLKPVEKNKIVFYDTGNYSGHGKSISVQLQKTRPDLDIVWILKKDLDLPVGVRKILTSDITKYIEEIETAKILVFDMYVDEFIKKRQDQYLLVVKHWSSVTLKTFGMMDKTLIQPAEIAKTKHSFGMTDYIISGSEFDEESCRKGFLYDGKFVRIGSCRSDVLFKSLELENKIRREYNIDRDTFLALYAPTWRRIDGVAEFDINSLGINLNIIKKTLEDKYNRKCNILVRLHPFVARFLDDVELPYDIINVCHYPDSQELLATCDALITDYSSIMFEYSYVRKPVFLHWPDYEKYINRERELLIQPDELPFMIAKTEDELVYNIKTFCQATYEYDVKNFLEKYGVHEDGHASERTALFINDLIEGKVDDADLSEYEYRV